MRMRFSMGFEGKRPTGGAPKHQCVLSRPWGLAEAMESFHRPVILGMLQVDKKKTGSDARHHKGHFRFDWSVFKSRQCYACLLRQGEAECVSDAAHGLMHASDPSREKM